MPTHKKPLHVHRLKRTQEAPQGAKSTPPASPNSHARSSANPFNRGHPHKSNQKTLSTCLPEERFPQTRPRVKAPMASEAFQSFPFFLALLSSAGVVAPQIFGGAAAKQYSALPLARLALSWKECR